jgi:hypothetical protein
MTVKDEVEWMQEEVLMSYFNVLATDPEVLGSIPGASRFSEKPRVWNRVHSAS